MVAHLPNYQIGETPFHAWLYQIARNLIVDTYRQEARRSTEPLEKAAIYPDGNPLVQTAVEQKWAVEQIHHALDLIDPIQREVIILRFMVGMSLQEVALTLEKTVGAVKTLQHRGLNALRVALL
jgi:RNA polymerase sigma-70 factor (ECF subfamily)